MSLNFGELGLQFSPGMTVSYYQSSSSNFTDNQIYFDLVQKTYTNNLAHSISSNYDFSQTLLLSTTTAAKSST
jgi:hypothetical protein